MPYRIVSYNLHGGKGNDWKIDYQRILLLLKELNADVVFLQEVDSQHIKMSDNEFTTFLKANFFTHIIEAPTRKTPLGWFGNAILSRYPLERSSIIDTSESGFESRNMIETYCQFPEGKVHLVNTHKGLNSLERKKQIKKLHTLLSTNQKTPIIVGGDINEWSFFTRALDELNTYLSSVPLQASFPSFLPLFKLDRFWIRPFNMKVHSKVVRNKKTRIYSDHCPILLDFELPKVPG